MRKHLPLVGFLLAAFLIGCGGRAEPADAPTAVVEQAATAVPTVEPTDIPSPAGEQPTAEPAACVEASAEFPLLPGLPPVTEDEHRKGPSDASITIIEYADFQ
jgi:hypothetical protein